MSNNKLPKSLHRNSTGWRDLASAIFSVNSKVLNPLVDRAKSLSSVFTMKSEDLNVRLNELGEFFSLGQYSDEDKPLLLQQRKDELLQKGDLYPIDKTLAREFGENDIRWLPLYAPKDLEQFPYGSVLATEEERASYSDISDWFLTCRGIVEAPISQIYSKPDEDGNALNSFEATLYRVIPPLIPTHIVFDGQKYVIKFRLSEELEFIYSRNTHVEIDLPRLQKRGQKRYRINIERLGLRPLDSDYSEALPISVTKQEVLVETSIFDHPDNADLKALKHNINFAPVEDKEDLKVVGGGNQVIVLPRLKNQIVYGYRINCLPLDAQPLDSLITIGIDKLNVSFSGVNEFIFIAESQDYAYTPLDKAATKLAHLNQPEDLSAEITTDSDSLLSSLTTREGATESGVSKSNLNPARLKETKIPPAENPQTYRMDSMRVDAWTIDKPLPTKRH